MDDIELGDFLLYAEAVLGKPASSLARVPGLVQRALVALQAPRISFAGIPLYPDVADRAAILAARLMRELPLPEQNRAVAYLCLRDQIERNEAIWIAHEQPTEIAEILDRVCAGMMSEDEFRKWVRDRVVEHETPARRLQRATARLLRRITLAVK